MFIPEDFKQLRLLLWNRETPEISAEDALKLYEANRQWVDVASMSEEERCFFQNVVARYGDGVFHG